MSKDIEISHDFNNHGGRYWAEVAGGDAELTYVNRKDGAIIIDHTFTPPEARGGKIAQALVERAVADAKDAGVKIVPRCPYVARLFDRRPEWAGLRAA